MNADKRKFVLTLKLIGGKIKSINFDKADEVAEFIAKKYCCRDIELEDYLIRAQIGQNYTSQMYKVQCVQYYKDAK